jgi:2-iminobutanoate/2-iminopropanoate deaminase
VTKRVIRTDQAPAPFQGAPYSQGIANGGFVFVSGQLGVDAGGSMVEGGISEQTEQVMKNLSAILEAAGTSLATWATNRRRGRRSRSRRCLPARSSRSK